MTNNKASIKKWQKITLWLVAAIVALICVYLFINRSGDVEKNQSPNQTTTKPIDKEVQQVDESLEKAKDTLDVELDTTELDQEIDNLL